MQNPNIIILIISFSFILLFGGLSYIRREGLSGQFAFEVLVITALVLIFSYITGIAINPVLFLAIIYLISMRGRLLVDLANTLSSRGRQRNAISLMQLALRLLPDRSTRLVTLVNMGIVQIRRDNPESAKNLFESVLKDAEEGGLGIKYEAACRYNLGLALQKLNMDAQAVQQFNLAMSVLPNSIFSKGAAIALRKYREKNPKETEELTK